MNIILHRGYHDKYIKENSYEGIKKALENNNYQGIECDIRETKDYHYIINHNSIIDSYIIRHTNFNTLNNKYNITTLESILSINTNKIILLEIKDYDINIDKLLKVLNKYKNRNIYIMSFYKKVIAKLKKQNIPFKLGILNYVLNSDNDYSKYDFVCILSNIITSKIYNYFKSINKEIFIYGIKDINKLRIYSEAYLIINNNKL